MPFVSAGRRIEDDDAAIAVAVGDEHFVGRGVHGYAGGAVDVARVVAAAALPVLADLQQELPGLRELQEIRVAVAVTGEPDVVVVIDVDAVLDVRAIRSRRPARPSLGRSCRLDRIRARPVQAGSNRRCRRADSCRARRSCAAGGPPRCDRARSTATPDTCPRIQLFGKCFGQDGSGLNRGTSCATVAAAAKVTAVIDSTTRGRRRLGMMILPGR